MARIFVVDDSREVRFLLRTVLQMEGHEVIEASDGADALGLAFEADDIMLLDVMMPRMTGTEFLAAVKAKGRDLPRVIVLTAKAGEADRQEAMDLGAVSFLTKPFDTDTVISEINRVLSAPGS